MQKGTGKDERPSRSRSLLPRSRRVGMSRAAHPDARCAAPCGWLEGGRTSAGNIRRHGRIPPPQPSPVNGGGSFFPHARKGAPRAGERMRRPAQCACLLASLRTHRPACGERILNPFPCPRIAAFPRLRHSPSPLAFPPLPCEAGGGREGANRQRGMSGAAPGGRSPTPTLPRERGREFFPHAQEGFPTPALQAAYSPRWRCGLRWLENSAALSRRRSVPCQYLRWAGSSAKTTTLPFPTGTTCTKALPATCLRFSSDR